MGVKIPEYHLKAPRDLKELRYRLKGGGRYRDLHQELTLTSMIDLFASIIIFLIQSFSASGDVLFINKDVVLPTASHGQELKRAPIITVMRDKVTLEGYDVGDNSNINELIEETDWSLPQLTEKLLAYKAFFDSIHSEDGVTFPAEVILQSDVETEFLYVKRVLYTLTKIGFGNINLVVRGYAATEAPKIDNSSETSTN